MLSYYLLCFFMEGCFMFQLGGGCFSDWVGFIFKGGGVPLGGTSVLVGGLSKKIIRWEVPLMPPTMGNPVM